MINQIISDDKQYYMNTFGDRIPLAFTHGDGITLYHENGDAYKDFFAGIAVSALGHSHPKLVEALRDQVGKVLHTSSLYYIENQASLAKALCEASCFDKAFFCNSGAEANEGAIKLARKYFYERNINRFEIITMEKSFHGRTITTATATGQEKYSRPYAPLTPGFCYVPINDIAALKNAVTDRTAAIMLELIQGESGVHPATAEYVQAVRDICDKHGILMIVDEVQTGIGRTGSLFAYQQYGVEPDILTLAKALGGGVPIGAVLANDCAADAFHPGDHGTTFGGNPLATRAGLTVLQTIAEEHLTENAKEVGNYFTDKLSALNSPLISEVRGMGLMIGVEFSSPVARDAWRALLDAHYLTGCVGDTVLRILPPLILTKQDVDEFITSFAEILSKIKED